MIKLIKVVLLIVVLVILVCINFDCFGGVVGNIVDLNNQVGINQFELGFVSDLISFVYFNQIIGDCVLFVVDQLILMDEVKVLLNLQVEWLIINFDFCVMIEGYVDEQGICEYNFVFGNCCVVVVCDYFVLCGVLVLCLLINLFGKECFVVICVNELCYLLNCCVVIVIVYSIGGLS